jgi:hypothetical protein
MLFNLHVLAGERVTRRRIWIYSRAQKDGCPQRFWTRPHARSGLILPESAPQSIATTLPEESYFPMFYADSIAALRRNVSGQ